MHEGRRFEPLNVLLTNRKKRFIQLHHNKFLIDQQKRWWPDARETLKTFPLNIRGTRQRFVPATGFSDRPQGADFRP
jgi:hypothetical protein